MSARRRRRAQDEEETHSAERWTVSYMDMVTVMMCLFIVLFAISHLDQQKFSELSRSLAAGFGDSAAAAAIVDGSSGVLDGGEGLEDALLPTESDLGFPDDGDAALRTALAEADAALETARSEVAELIELRDRIATDLEAVGLQDDVHFSITERGLVVGLVTENTFFTPASSDMPDTTLEVIDTIAATLTPLSNDLLLEGHANILPDTRPYATNWELSADRATKVLRRMVEHGDIAPTRVRAVGYGDAYPAAEGESEAALAQNRRVDVVVLSDEPEQIRALLPELAGATEGT